MREASVKVDREFEALRGGRAACFNQPKQVEIVDEAAIQAVCQAWRFAVLDGDAWYRRHGLSDEEYESRRTARIEVMGELRQSLAKGRLEVIQPVLGQFLHLLGLDLRGDPETLRQLAWSFLEVVIQTQADLTRRDEGEPVAAGEPPRSPLLKKKAPAAKAPPAPARKTGNAPTFLDLHAAWARLVPDRPQTTVKDFERGIVEFMAFTGHKPASEVTRADITAFVEHLLTERRLHHKTVEKKISYLCTVAQVALDAGKLSVNPAARIKVPRPKVVKRSRLPFTAADLRTIFSSPLYTAHDRPLGGRGEAAVWLPLLGLYTGARLEELGQLRANDVLCENGIHFMWITDVADDEDGAQRVKSESSRRRVPVHPRLIEAGFLRYAAQFTGSAPLFPVLKADSKGKLTGNWSKWFGRYRRKVLKLTDPRKVFHSFRHAFKDACAEAEIDSRVIEALMGHTDTSTHAKYGTPFSLRRLNKELCRMDYPDFAVPVVIPDPNGDTADAA